MDGVSVVHVLPGDVICYTPAADTTESEAEAIQAALTERFPLALVMRLEPGERIQVLSRGRLIEGEDEGE